MWYAETGRRGEEVALFTRAWIEMYSIIGNLYCNIVALFTRAWIEINYKPSGKPENPGRPLYEGVD